MAEYWQQLTDIFINPQKRLFLGYLLLAFILAVIWLTAFKRYHFVPAIKTVLAKKVWWSASARLDYQLLLVNRFLMLLLSPLLLSQLALATVLFYQLYEWMPSRPTVLSQWSDGAVGLLFTTVYFVVDDFSRFYVHRLLHRWPVLWAFHKVHHSAETLTPITVLRTHPVEAILFSLRTVFVQAIVVTLFIFFVGDRVSLVMVLGANIFAVVFNSIGSNLRHSHIALRYPRWLEKVLLSPAQHQIHHSVDVLHHDKNFGVVFSIWDRVWGCFAHSEKNKALVFGLDHAPKHNLISTYCYPFKESFLVIKNRLVN